ncbi:MAG TPA: flavodoxin domain-containing protein [Chthonomonadales bacterium]|nr:flavodoxin domain-containing protein [Chthonomonadales bacterium]
MGKVLVIYDTKTGHTGHMARRVAEGAESVHGTEVRLVSVDEATAEDVLWCDGVAVGSPTNMGTLSWRMKRFWDETAAGVWGEVDGKIGCAFSSQGGWGGGGELTCMASVTVLMNFGFLVFGVTEYVGERMTLHYGATLAGEPRTEAEVAACTKLGERLAQWVAVYADRREYLHPVRLRKAAKSG